MRLVPKTRSAAPRLEFGLESVQVKPLAFSPDPRKARTALGFFAERPRVEVKPTEKDRLEVSLREKDFTELFGAGRKGWRRAEAA